MFDRYKQSVNSVTHFASFGIDRADGMRYQMYMNDALAYRYYDSSYSGSVHGLDTTKPLAVNYGSEEENTKSCTRQPTALCSKQTIL